MIPSIELVLLSLIVALISFPLFYLIYLIVINGNKYPVIVEYEEETSFQDASSKTRTKFPSIKESPSRTLSVIIPAYNEEERLPPMLDECLTYLKEKSKISAFTYEVIIVDDGSRDKTSEVGHTYASKYSSDKVRVLTLRKNRGKGGAVRLGMLRARGEYLLFADADGATKFADYDKLETSIKQLCEGSKEASEELAVVCGSRAHLEKESVVTRSFFRTVLMYGFHFIVYLFAVRNMRDTQCGFKLLTRRTARIVFNSLHVERWAFDVEILFIAQSLNIPITEVPVTWTEIEGSKVTPVLSWIQMGIDIFIIWLKYTLGLWGIKGDILQ